MLARATHSTLVSTILLLPVLSLEYLSFHTRASLSSLIRRRNTPQLQSFENFNWQ